MTFDLFNAIKEGQQPPSEDGLCGRNRNSADLSSAGESSRDPLSNDWQQLHAGILVSPGELILLLGMNRKEPHIGIVVNDGETWVWVHVDGKIVKHKKRLCLYRPDSSMNIQKQTGTR